MPMFKVTDVRVQYKLTRQPNVWIDGLNTGSDLTGQVNAVRAALMLDVFLAGRDCYFDTGTNVFATMVPWPAPIGGPVGLITSWEARIPVAVADNINFLIRVIDPAGARPTSGDASVSSMMLSVNEATAALVLAVLRSSYRAYRSTPMDPQIIRNTEYTDVSPLWM